MIRERINDIKGSLKKLWDRLTVGETPEGPSLTYYEVDRRDLTAFVTGEPLSQWNRKMSTNQLAMRWEEGASTLYSGLHMLGEREYRDQAVNAIRAMKQVAGYIRDTDNFAPVVTVSAQNIDILAESRRALNLLKMRLHSIGSAQTKPNEPGNIDALYYKAAPLFAPYARQDGNRLATIPKYLLETIVDPLLPSLGIDPEERNASAQGWERLGKMLTDHDPYPYQPVDASGPFILRTHLYGIALAMCKAEQYEDVVLPGETIGSLEYSLHHLPYMIQKLREDSTKIVNIRNADILQTAYDGIREHMAPWFAYPGQHPGNQYAYGD